ncbi:MAG: APC family permease [Rhodobiaceae bacterium]|nr:APC family permease [Rhodobiaceae bacterium]MCC0042491.1 APC family permease [Rhodobiaceae bacterium]
MFASASILAAVLLTGAVLFHPRLVRARLWRATITPLASIIGSGFLVLGPLLEVSYGAYAPLAMAFLCVLAYAFGDAVRFNIAALDASANRGHLSERLERSASWVLAFAYIISVAYYLNLFGAFGVSLTEVNDAVHAKLLTTSIFLFVLLTGWTRGFTALEKLEQLSVSFKLAIIAGLILGLAIYFAGHAASGELVVNPSTRTGAGALALVFGLVVTVQGFETSRYLGDEYDAKTRIRSMRLAQWISTAIYMVYIGLMAYVFPAGELELKETEIVSMMDLVAPILPLLLVAAALSAQLSAAVADTGGAGGLFVELTRRRVDEKHAYLLLVGIGLAVTWLFNVFEIIAYASRAFALYYGMQAAIAAATAHERGAPAWRVLAYGALAALGLAIAVFGTPAEV